MVVRPRQSRGEGAVVSIGAGGVEIRQWSKSMLDGTEERHNV